MYCLVIQVLTIINVFIYFFVLIHFSMFVGGFRRNRLLTVCVHMSTIRTAQTFDVIISVVARIMSAASLFNKSAQLIVARPKLCSDFHNLL